jgi:hypothetical protein
MGEKKEWEKKEKNKLKMLEIIMYINNFLQEILLLSIFLTKNKLY